MSAAVRQILADAVETVDGLSCHPYFRQSTKSGAAHIRLDRINYPNRFGGVVTWQVIMILPQDVEIAEKVIDTKLPLLYEALSPHMVVTTATPQEIILSDGVRLPCLFIEGTRETEES